jgi:hypothetical protein
MADALLWRVMVPKDRVTLRNLVIVILMSTTFALLIGISCLGRVHRPAIIANESVRSSAGGVPTATPAPPPPPPPAPPASPVGTTRITSSERERGASATGSPEPAPTKQAEGFAPYESPPPEPPPPATTVRRYVQSAPPATSAASPTEEIDSGSIIVEEAGLPSDAGPADGGIPLADASF